MSFLFGTSNKTYLKEVLDREIVYGEDECILILDIAYYGVIENVNYLPTRLNFLVNDRQYNDFKLNHRYPNDSYLTITKTYGKYVSRLGYPVVLKLEEAKKPVKITLQIYSTKDDEEFLSLQINLYLQMYCDQDHRIGDMVIKHFYDPNILKLCAYPNLEVDLYPSDYTFFSTEEMRYLKGEIEEIENPETLDGTVWFFDKQDNLYAFNTHCKLERRQVWTTYEDKDSYLHDKKRNCVHEMTHRESDVETRTITYYDLIEVPQYNRETLEEQLLYHSEDIYEDCNESSDE